jgi:hypothetical protein
MICTGVDILFMRKLEISAEILEAQRIVLYENHSLLIEGLPQPIRGSHQFRIHSSLASSQDYIMKGDLSCLKSIYF